MQELNTGNGVVSFHLPLSLLFCQSAFVICFILIWPVETEGFVKKISNWSKLSRLDCMTCNIVKRLLRHHAGWWLIWGRGPGGRPLIFYRKEKNHRRKKSWRGKQNKIALTPPPPQKKKKKKKIQYQIFMIKPKADEL